MTASITPSKTRNAIIPAKLVAAAEQLSSTPQQKMLIPRTFVTGNRCRSSPTYYRKYSSVVCSKRHTLRNLRHGIGDEKRRRQPGKVIPLHLEVRLETHYICVLFRLAVGWLDKILGAYVEGDFVEELEKIREEHDGEDAPVDLSE